MRNVLLKRRPQPLDPIDLPEVDSALLRRIYLQRGITQAEQLACNVNALLSPQLLTGIDQAVQLLIDVMQKQQQIVIVGDFDADGATSTAVALLTLRALGAQCVDYLVPDRFNDGYGLTPNVAEQAINKGAELIITVDNGISSFAGVAYAQQQGCRVLITDHHLPGEQLPTAEAIVNPNLATCTFPSKALAGVGVIFYLMLALRRALRRLDWFEDQKIAVPNLAEYLDLVALGTVADLVPLDSNNRILVHQGLSRMRAGHSRPGIKALLEITKRQTNQLSTNDLGFFLAPRLNAAGRLDNMSIGIELLLCQDMTKAREIAYELDTLNQTRKEIEQGMQQEAMVLCDHFVAQSEDLPTALALFHEEWHQGVIGILAARLKERFYRPVIVFAPAGDGLLKGSGRSIIGLHLRDLLERINTHYPSLIERFGGHAMAVGLTIHQEKLPLFQQVFTEIAAQWLTAHALEDIIWSDGELSNEELTLSTAELLRNGGPWGQAFPEPMFDGEFTILQQRLVGQRHLKLLLTPINEGLMVDAIAFNIDLTRWPDSSIKTIKMAYQLDINEFRGQRQVQLLVRHIWPH